MRGCSKTHVDNVTVILNRRIDSRDDITQFPCVFIIQHLDRVYFCPGSDTRDADCILLCRYYTSNSCAMSTDINMSR